MINGLLLVDKPEGLTSHDVVGRVRRILNMKSVGHTGTLDPMASGLMVLLLGEATKLSDYLLSGDKGYGLTAQLGIKTDTQDVTGEVLYESPVDLPQSLIESEVLALQGEQSLPIPLFSAKKINGKKLYEYARSGEFVEIPLRQMKFYDLENLKVEPTQVSLELRCSKGSFIRSWAAQLGENLGVGGALSRLRRTYSAPYGIDAAITLENLAEGLEDSEISEHTGDLLETLFSASFIPLRSALPGWKGVTVSGKDERLLVNGQVSYGLTKRFVFEQKQVNASGERLGIRAHSGEDGELLGLIEVAPCKPPKIKRIFKR